MKKPKTLYEYNSHHELEKHKVSSECWIEAVYRSVIGTRWRCRGEFGPHDEHDLYGWDTLKAAKHDEVDRIHHEIAQLQKHLSKLRKYFRSKGK